MSLCCCGHPSGDHRRGVGRCTRPACQCLQGPLPTVRADRSPARAAAVGTAVVDSSGVVVAFTPPARQSERLRLEDMLWRRIDDAVLPIPIKQFYWARPERQFRSDFAYVAERLLLEVDGGIWMPGGGGHSHPMHLETQHHRDNLAVILGYRLLRFTEKMIRDGTAVDHIKRALQSIETVSERMLI